MVVIDKRTLAHSRPYCGGREGALYSYPTGLRSVSRQWFTSTGVDTGPREMNVNGSVTPVDFYIQPPAGVRWGIPLIILAVSDNATFNQTDFAGIAGGLVNGVRLLSSRDGADVEIFGGFVVKFNYDWISLPTEISLTTWAGTAQTLGVRFHIHGDAGEFGILDGDHADRFVVRVQDNLTSLVAFRALCRYVVLEY